MKVEVANFVGLDAAKYLREDRIADAVGQRGIERVGYKFCDEQHEELGTKPKCSAGKPERSVGPVGVEHVDVELVANQCEETGVLLLFLDEEAQGFDVVVVSDFAGGLE